MTGYDYTPPRAGLLAPRRVNGQGVMLALIAVGLLGGVTGVVIGTLGGWLLRAWHGERGR